MKASDAKKAVEAKAKEIIGGNRRLAVECSVEEAPHCGKMCEQVRCSLKTAGGDANHLLFHPSTVRESQWAGLERNIAWLADVDERRHAYMAAQERAGATTAKVDGIGPVTAAMLCERHGIDSCEALCEFLSVAKNRADLAADPNIQASAGDVAYWLEQVTT